LAKNTISKTKKILYFMKTYYIILTCTSIFVGIISMFIASLFVKMVSLDNMNTFVSIILGIVATTISIVSMFMSFYNLEKAEESENKQKETFNNMLQIQSSMMERVNKIDDTTTQLGTFLRQKDNSINQSAETTDWKTGDVSNE
jgi:cell shape-determining protein MreC